MNIFLIGFMGTGKSTVATFLHEHYDMEIVEMDECIVKRQEMSVSQIFEVHGETYFRQLETELLNEIQKNDGQVISCGGGTPMRECNVAKMKENGVVVLLVASPETIYSRVKDDDNRPLLRGNMNVDYIAMLADKRREKYEQAADIIIDTDAKDTEQICREILEKVGHISC